MPPHSEGITSVFLMFKVTCLTFFRLRRGQSVPVTGLLFGFWVITVTPDFFSCYGPQEEIMVVADFIQQFQVHTCHWCCWVVQTLQTYTARSNSAIEFASIFCMRDLTCQQLLKWSFIGHCWWHCKVSPCFCVYCLWRDDVNTHNLQPVSWWMKETPKSHCSPHDIVTEGCSESFLHLCLIFLRVKHHILQMHCSFKSTILKLYEHVLAWEGVLRVVTAKLTRLTWKIVIPWHLVAESCPTSHSQFQQWVGGAFRYIFIRHFYKIEGGFDIYICGNFAIYCSVTKQVAWSRQYSDLHLGYVWFEFWLWYDCLEWGFSWISSVSPGKHARVIPVLLSVQCFNFLALELVI
jgi:hypothetical protein